MILSALTDAGHEAYIVGGFVRDRLLFRESGDIDITTSATPDEVGAVFPESELVGAHFGVRVLKGYGFDIQIATFRLDGVYKDSRHPVAVEYTKDVREDVKRRDFTINTILMDRNGVTHDYQGGQADLIHKLVRAVGYAPQRFSEDGLRMMRAVRLACRLDFDIETHTFLAIRYYADTIVNISTERIREELDKILTSGEAERGIRLLDHTGLLRHILPEFVALFGVKQNPVHHPEGDVYEHTMGLLRRLPKGCEITLALAALLHDIGKPATLGEKDGQPTFYGHEEVGAVMTREILTRLKYPTEIIERVVNNVAEHMRFRLVDEMRKSKLYRFLRQPHFDELLALHKLDSLSGRGNLRHAEFVERKLAEVPPEVIHPVRLVTGKDLISLGLEPGPAFKTILERIETEQLEGNISTHEEAMAFVANTIGTSKAAMEGKISAQ